MNTDGQISPPSDEISYIYVIVDDFTHFFLLHPSPKKVCIKSTHFILLFDCWIVQFGMPDISVTDNGNEYVNGEFTHNCRTYNVQFRTQTPYALWSNGLVENSNRQLNTFLRTVLDSQYDTWSQM